MNFHFITVITVYVFALLIIHISLELQLNKTKVTTMSLLNETDRPSKSAEGLIIDINELNDLNDLNDVTDVTDFKGGKSNAQNDLLQFLEKEKVLTNNDLDIFAEKSTEIKPSNHYTSNNITEHDTTNISTDSFFKRKDDMDSYSFDPVPTDSCKQDIIADLSKNNDHSLQYIKKDKLFNDVEAFDDFDSTYANI